MTTYHDAARSSASAEWPTPQQVVDRLAAEFGPFDLDPAATAANAKAALYYTREDDGLAQPWAGTVWLNPPYGSTGGPGHGIRDWLRKAAETGAAGHRVVCLVPCRVDAQWWREATASASLVRILPQRLRYGAHSAPFASAVIVFGPLPGRHGSTARLCARCRAWFFAARSDAKSCSPACRKALSRSRLAARKRDRGRGGCRMIGWAMINSCKSQGSTVQQRLELSDNGHLP